MAQDAIIGKLTCYKTIEICWVCPKMSTSVAFESLDEKGQQLVRDRDLARQPFLVVRCFPKLSSSDVFQNQMCTSNIIRNFTCQQFLFFGGKACSASSWHVADSPATEVPGHHRLFEQPKIRAHPWHDSLLQF